MDREKLIAILMTEVKDEVLRDKLLKIVVEDNGSEYYDSLMARELVALGLNPSVGKELVHDALKSRIMGSYCAGTVFLIVGGVLMLLSLSNGSISSTLFFGIFAAAGIATLFYARKIARLQRL